jgi:hypothetical protein
MLPQEKQVQMRVGLPIDYLLDLGDYFERHPRISEQQVIPAPVGLHAE